MRLWIIGASLEDTRDIKAVALLLYVVQKEREVLVLHALLPS